MMPCFFLLFQVDVLFCFTYFKCSVAACGSSLLNVALNGNMLCLLPLLDSELL